MKLIDLIQRLIDGRYRLGEKYISDEGFGIEITNDRQLIGTYRGVTIDLGRVLTPPAGNLEPGK